MKVKEIRLGHLYCGREVNDQRQVTGFTERHPGGGLTVRFRHYYGRAAQGSEYVVLAQYFASWACKDLSVN